MLIISFVSSFLFLGAKKILKENYEQIIKKESGIGINEQIKKINLYASFLNEVGENYVNLSDVLAEISLNTPENINLISAQIDRIEKKIIINGQAAKRDDFLNFKEMLEELEMFTSVDFPIQNIAEKQDINFTISADLKI